MDHRVAATAERTDSYLVTGQNQRRMTASDGAPHSKFKPLASSSLTVRVLEESLVCNFWSFVAGVAPVAPAVALVKFRPLLLRPAFWSSTRNARALSLKRLNRLSFDSIAAA